MENGMIDSKSIAKGWFSIKRIIAIIFLFLIICFFFIWYKFPNNFYIGSYFPNITTELLGILVTIFFVDYLLKVERKKQDDKYTLIAYNRIATQIKTILELFLQIYKASSTKDAVKKFTSYDDFLNKDNFDHILEQYAYFDFKKEAPVVPKQDWFKFTEYTINFGLKEISSIIDRHLSFLDIFILEELEKLANDPQLLIIKKQKDINMVWRQEGMEWRRGVQWHNKDLFRKTFANLLSIIKGISKKNCMIDFTINQGSWSEKLAPKTGSARFTDQELEEIIKKLS